VVPPAGDTDLVAARQETRSRLGVDDSAVVALFLGGDWHRKGLPEIVSALAMPEVPFDVVLWVVGRGNRAEVERMARRLGVRSRVTVVGEVPDVVPLYAAADIFVLASNYETFSIPCFEAAASGLPIIATDVHGARDIVSEGEGGILVDRTPQSIASALLRLAVDEEHRHRMGKRANQYAAAFTWDRAACLTLKAYDQLLPGRVRPCAES
jgi:UDP-glucose:(heptosyl)LPS alpha-1,3-glucosyltransferase